MRILDFEEAMQVLEGSTKGNRHPYYDRVTDLADKYLKLMTGENIEDLLIQFNPREDETLFEQRVRITKTIVGAVSGKVKGPFEKVGRSNNVTKKLLFTEDTESNELEDLEETLERFWGDETLDDYMEQRIIDLAFSDPNSFIVTEHREQNGDILVYPFEVSSHEAIGYHYTNNSLDYLIVHDGGKKYTIYTKGFTVVIVEKKDEDVEEQQTIVVPGAMFTMGEPTNTISEDPGESKIKFGNKTYEIRFIENECDEIPAIRVGYKRDEMTNGNTYVSPMQKAIPRLEKIIKADSELDLVVSLHAFPQKLQYLQKCDGDISNNRICEHGKIRGTDDHCRKCSGTGFLFHTSAANAITYEMPTPDELNSGAVLPDLDKLISYKHPDIAIIEFENKYTRQLEEAVITDVFVSQNFERSNGTATATEIEYDMDSVYDTLYPFARKFSAIYKKQVRLTACYIGITDGLKVVHQFPKDFKMKSVTQLLGELKMAEDANAPEFFKKQLNEDIAMKIYHDNPTALNKFKVKQQHMPFLGKTREQVKDIILSGKSTRENTILWVEFENIMQALEDEHLESLTAERIEQGVELSFYDLPYQTRLALVREKIKQVDQIKASELGIAPLNVEEEEETEE